MAVGQRIKRPGYTKNGTLKAMLNYHKYKAALIEEQLEIQQNILQLKEPLTGWKGRLFYFVLSHHFRLSKNRLWSKTH